MSDQPVEPVDPVDPVEPSRDLVPVVKPVSLEPEPVPGFVDLFTRSARVGFDTVGLIAGDVAGASVRLARAVLPPAVAERRLDAVEQEIDRRRAAARRREEASREDAAAALYVVVNKVIGAAVDQVDVPALVQRIPLDEVVESVDLGSIVRDSTTGLAGETVDAIRVQTMGLDLWMARFVDKLLRRTGPRDLVLDGYDVFGSEIKTPKGMQ